MIHELSQAPKQWSARPPDRHLVGSTSGVDIFKFNEAGLVSQHWGAFDTLGVMLQLGLIPAPSMQVAA